MHVGDIVKRKDGQNLHSGVEVYSDAIVVALDPLILVSRGTDMRWQHTIQDVEFTVTGSADNDQVTRCMRRI